MQGLVSIVMPAYNDGIYINESIKSVQAQTYTNWELLIVNDCSTDDTEDKIKEFLSDTRIKLLRNKKNSGAAVSRNYALREAKGKWIAFLDADDVWLPKKLEKQLNFMIQNNYKFSYTDYRIRLNGEWKPYVNTGPMVVTKRKLYNYCYFSTITVMYDREYVGLVQIADLKKNNDYAMWFQIIEKKLNSKGIALENTDYSDNSLLDACQKIFDDPISRAFKELVGFNGGIDED